MGLVVVQMDLPGFQFSPPCFSLVSWSLKEILYHLYSFKQVGLKGEAMNLVSPSGISSVDWMQGSLIAQKQQPLTWHKV